MTAPKHTTSEHTVIHELFDALNNRDYKRMWKCYEPEAGFYDPAYEDLNYEEIKAMWHQICKRQTDLEAIITKVKQIDDDIITYRWRAEYTHAQYGSEMVNKIKGTVTLSERGLILNQTEKYNLWKWFSMATGFVGTYFGWMPNMHKSLRASVNKSLHGFMRKNNYRLE